MGANLIYGLFDPRDGSCRYIGKTTKGMVRARAHGRAGFPAQDPNRSKAKWVSGLHGEGLAPEARALEEFAAPDALDAAESFWIAQARGMGWPLTNISAGGAPARGIKHSAEARARMSAAGKGKPKSRAHAAAAGRAHRGLRFSDASRERVSRAMGGAAVVDEQGNVFNTQSEAARHYGISSACVSQSVRGGYMAGGHRFQVWRLQ